MAPPLGCRREVLAMSVTDEIIILRMQPRQGTTRREEDEGLSNLNPAAHSQTNSAN